MTRLMLINGQHAEEVRVAIIEKNNDLWELESYRVAVADSQVERGNIYRGVVTNIEPSLDAAFIDYGSARHGFLARHDLVDAAQHHKGSAIDEVLQKGQPIVVQIARDAMSTKGANLTTNVSLAGRYMVLMPFDDSQRGVSRKLEDDDLRKKLREKVKNLVAGDFGFIVRTNASDQTKTELKADLDQLKRLWKHVQSEGDKGKGPRLLHNDQDLVIQVLRDHLDAKIDEVLVDDEELLTRSERYLSAVMPRRKVKLTLYNERLPLFSRYNIEPKIAAIYRRRVALPGGGSLVIDGTEALTAVDVNSGKAKGGDRQSDTAYQTNLEAATEVARQLRLRDIGGLVVVDFIDMRSRKHQRAVEKALRDAMKPDRARHHAGSLSVNGLLEINRQRVGQTLQTQTHVRCPTCRGVGHLVNPDLVALGLLRQLEARAATGRLRRANIALHPQVADLVQNRRRAQLVAMERDYGIAIVIVGRPELELAEERIEWINREGPAQPPPQRAERPKSQRAGGRPEGPPRAGAEQPTRDKPQKEPETESTEAQEGPRPEETRSKRRRRRRGRRKKKESAGGAQHTTTGDETIKADGDNAEAEIQEGKPAETPKVNAGRSKRKRRSRKKAPRKPEEPQESPVESTPDDSVSADTKDAKPTKSRRSRRRRKRSASKKAETNEAET